MWVNGDHFVDKTKKLRDPSAYLLNMYRPKTFQSFHRRFTVYKSAPENFRNVRPY